MTLLQAVSGYIRTHIQEIHTYYIPQEVLEIILLFYKLDLSKYQYFATFNSTQSDQSSYLRAFNLDSTSPTTQHLRLYPSDGNNIFQNAFGSTYKFSVFNELPLSLRSHLFPDYYHIKDKSHIIYKITGPETQIIQAYLIEADKLINLPKIGNNQHNNYVFA